MSFRFLLLLLCLLAPGHLVFAQTIAHLDGDIVEQGNVQERVGYAHAYAAEQNWNTYWIGYSVEKPMHPRTHMGMWISDGSTRNTLGDLLNIRPLFDGSEGTVFDNDAQSDSYKVARPIGLILRFDSRPEQKQQQQLVDIGMSTMDAHVDLDDFPLIWIGPAQDDISIALLKDFYDASEKRSPEDDLMEDLVSSIGIHAEADLVLPFLKRVLESDADEDVRERAVVAIAQLDIRDSVDLLIHFAHQQHDEEISESARFWLGQKASRLLATKSDADIVATDAETEIQKQAVFALSQFDESESIPLLIELGNTHRNPEVRKQAVFWLSQSDDEQALEAIILWLTGGTTIGQVRKK